MFGDISNNEDRLIRCRWGIFDSDVDVDASKTVASSRMVVLYMLVSIGIETDTE